MSEQEKQPIYSYHTFIFPFMWNNGGRVKRAHFERCINKEYWTLDLFGEFRNKARIDDSRREQYAQYQYFNTPARRAIYTEKDSQQEIVRNYLCKPFTEDNADAFYVIRKGTYIYSLHIKGLRLKLYNSGIGFLVYELENADYRSIEDVNRINEYGRRIYCPYIYDVNNLTSSLTADSIHMEGADFPSPAEEAWRITADASNAERTPKTKLARIVTLLLTNGSVTVTTDENANSEDTLYIEPIIDDRMFVACFVQDKAFADLMAEWTGSEYRWLSDALEKAPDAKDSAARKLHEFVFVDGDGITCTNRPMLHALLEQHVYARWAEKGTIHGVTEFSMVCVSSAEQDYIVKNPFLTQYIEFAMLALAQRASLIAFERRISLVSSDYKKAQNLMSDYVNFKSQLLLTEVTPQQQGMELYELLLESLFINKEHDEMESRIRSLFDQKNFTSERRMNGILLAIAILGAVEFVEIILHWLGCT